MTRHLSVRSRLTLLYASIFVACGAALVAITYLLLAHNLAGTKTQTDNSSSDVQRLIQQCVLNATAKGAASGDAETKCAALYANGVKAGASAQRGTTLNHLLAYSLLTLAAVTVLMVVAGWLVAGRILRPIHTLTAAARAASEQNLSQRLALQGPHDELRELSDTFDDMLARLERAFTSQQQFIANASHELRTPLTVMRTSIDVVLAKPNPTPNELRRMSLDVRDAVERAEELITALLTLARNELSVLAPEPLDLAVIAEDALETRNPDGLTVTSTLECAPVAGDSLLLEHLVANLLDNAERYNTAAGTIAISTAVNHNTSLLHVVNTGPVVPPEQVDRLFLPFTRLDGRTHHEGFGLGLALVASITAVHGGTISASAAPTGGLDLTVALPCRITNESSSATGHRPEPARLKVQ